MAIRTRLQSSGKGNFPAPAGNAFFTPKTIKKTVTWRAGRKDESLKIKEARKGKEPIAPGQGRCAKRKKAHAKGKTKF